MAQIPEELFRWSAKDIARICGVDLSTARRWKRGAICLPYTARALLSRDLGYLHPRWKGWVINDKGELCSPENWIATPGDVLAIQLTQAQLSTYRAQNRGLIAALEEARAAGYEEQPTIDQWEIATG